MNFTISFNTAFTYAIDPSGVIALATLTAIAVIVYGVYKIQATKKESNHG